MLNIIKFQTLIDEEIRDFKCDLAITLYLVLKGCINIIKNKNCNLNESINYTAAIKIRILYITDHTVTVVYCTVRTTNSCYLLHIPIVTGNQN